MGIRKIEQKKQRKQEGINMLPFHAFPFILNKIHEWDKLIKLYSKKEVANFLKEQTKLCKLFSYSGEKCPNFSAKYNTQNQTRNYKVTKTSNFAFLYKKYSPHNWTITISLNEEYFPHAN